MAMVNQPVLNQELELFLEDKTTEFSLKIHKRPTATPVNEMVQKGLKKCQQTNIQDSKMRSPGWWQG